MRGADVCRFLVSGVVPLLLFAVVGALVGSPAKAEEDPLGRVMFEVWHDEDHCSFCLAELPPREKSLVGRWDGRYADVAQACFTADGHGVVWASPFDDYDADCPTLLVMLPGPDGKDCAQLPGEVHASEAVHPLLPWIAFFDGDLLMLYDAVFGHKLPLWKSFLDNKGQQWIVDGPQWLGGGRDLVFAVWSYDARGGPESGGSTLTALLLSS